MPSAPPSDLARSWASATEAQARAEARRGLAFDEVLSVAGVDCRVRITGEELARRLTPALEHLTRRPGSVPEIDLRAWDGADGEDLPWYPEAALDGGTSGPARVHADRRSAGGAEVRVRYQPDERTLQLFDPASQVGLWCAADAAALPSWELGAPMRTLWHWVLEPRGRCLVHAAAVGGPDGGVLWSVGAGRASRPPRSVAWARSCATWPTTTAWSRWQTMPASRAGRARRPTASTARASSTRPG